MLSVRISLFIWAQELITIGPPKQWHIDQQSLETRWLINTLIKLGQLLIEMTFGTIEYRNVLRLVIDLINFIACWSWFDVLGVIVARVLPVVIVRLLQHRSGSSAEVHRIARVSTCSSFLDGKQILSITCNNIAHAAIGALVANRDWRVAVFGLLQAAVMSREHRLKLIQVIVDGSVPAILIQKLMMSNLAIAPLLRVLTHLSCSLFERGLAELLHLESENHAAERHPILMVRNLRNHVRCLRHILKLIKWFLIFGLISFLVTLIVKSMVEILRLPFLLRFFSQDGALFGLQNARISRLWIKLVVVVIEDEALVH